jgi:peptidoglycan/LPS O-acetylase OafA/YrhL
MIRSGWIRWLEVALIIVLAYAVMLVVAGTVAGSLFSVLGFGPPDAIDTDAVHDYLRLPYLVLGAVLAGWTLTMLQLVRRPLRDGATWVVPVLLRSLALWFTLDTGMSLALDFPTHAAFNVPFAIALAVPLIRLRTAPNSIDT